MEPLTKKQFKVFRDKIGFAAIVAGKILHHHDLDIYCQTLINASRTLHNLAEMACSDRLDLLDPGEDGLIDLLASKIRAFCLSHLGLDAQTSFDPRGAVVVVKALPQQGDSWSGHDLLCVPTPIEPFYL